MPKGHKDTFATLEEIVDGVCLDLGEGSQRKEQYLRWGIQEVERWHYDQAREVRTVELTMTAWKSIQLPNDCIDWFKLGVKIGNDLKTFVKTHDITLTYDRDENGVKKYNENPQNSDFDLQDMEVEGTHLWRFHNLTNYGEDPGKLFGVVVKDNGFGYFTEHRSQDSCEIQFKTKVPAGSKIYLEYLSTAFCPNKETLIHPYAKELITLGIHYRRLKFSKEPRGVVFEAKREYEEEQGRVQDRMWDYTTEDIREYLLSGYQLTPKK